MNMNTDKIKSYLQEYATLKSIQSLLHWDMETMMPSGAIQDRARHLSYVQGKIHRLITSKQYENLLLDLAASKPNRSEKRLLKELRWDYELLKAQPLRHVLAVSESATIANHVWARARKDNDWQSFRPHLQKLIELKRRESDFFKTKKPYDALLRMHDKEFDSRRINQLFAELKVGLIKLTAEVEKDGRFTQVQPLTGPFNLAAQQELSQLVARLFGLPPEHSRLDTSTHPFSINISPLDQRITTRYTEEHLDSLSSTMHEVGHALYEHHLPREWEGTPFQEAISLSMHESQSRFWENVIGRSREFCQYLLPLMHEKFPTNLKGVDAEDLFLKFNHSVPGLIRVESSELFYNLHIIIRYELEDLIFNQGLEAADLPELWNEKYQAYLGIKPRNFSEGILQDSHWAGGAFGYFPTYTLGNLISGSLYQQIQQAIPNFKQDIATGNFQHILEFLKVNIYSKGRSMNASDIVGPLNVNDYLNYLREKFRR
jgi:carboxypeptidase Taq